MKVQLLSNFLVVFLLLSLAGVGGGVSISTSKEEGSVANEDGTTTAPWQTREIRAQPKEPRSKCTCCSWKCFGAGILFSIVVVVAVVSCLWYIFELDLARVKDIFGRIFSGGTTSSTSTKNVAERDETRRSRNATLIYSGGIAGGNGTGAEGNDEENVGDESGNESDSSSISAD